MSAILASQNESLCAEVRCAALEKAARLGGDAHAVIAHDKLDAIQVSSGCDS